VKNYFLKEKGKKESKDSSGLFREPKGSGIKDGVVRRHCVFMPNLLAFNSCDQKRR